MIELLALIGVFVVTRALFIIILVAAEYRRRNKVTNK